MILNSLYTITVNRLLLLWGSFLDYLPYLLGTILIVVLGWFISIGVGRLVTEILKKLRLNQLLEKGGWKKAMEKAEIKVDASGFIGAIVKWILFVVFLMAGAEILGWGVFVLLLQGVLGYLPRVFVSVLIFVVTVILVDIAEKVTRAGVEGIRVGYGKIVSSIVKGSIWFFAILTILNQLQIAELLTGVLFSGLVATLVLIFGLSFGLGGKEVAAEILKDFKKKMEE